MLWDCFGSWNVGYYFGGIGKIAAINEEIVGVFNLMAVVSKFKGSYEKAREAFDEAKVFLVTALLQEIGEGKEEWESEKDAEIEE